MAANTMNMKIVTRKMMADLLLRAAATPRHRMNLNLHTELTDPTNRFLNAGLAGTYIRPHRHRVGRWELLNVLDGRVDIVIFTAAGEIRERFALGSDGDVLVEIPGGEWHSFVFHAPAAVVLEIKPGPYEAQLDKEFAEWAPAEDDAAAVSFLTWLETARAGETWLRS
jgi:cupin fold WbuC family metalloprotein